MRNSVLMVCAALFAMLASTFVAAQDQSIVGRVTASQIVSTGGSTGVGIWMKKLNCHDEGDCARRLVRAGGKYVLVTNHGTYLLSDQMKAAQFAGEAVTVMGTVDNAKRTVTVSEMESYPPIAARIR